MVPQRARLDVRQVDAQGAVRAQEQDQRCRAWRRPGRCLPQSFGVGEVPAHPGEGGGREAIAEEHVEELDRRIEVGRQGSDDVILAGLAAWTEQPVVLVVDRIDEEVLVVGPPLTLRQLPVVVPLPGRTVVPPTDGLQHRDRRGVEGVPEGEAPQSDGFREPLVERDRTGADRLEELLDVRDQGASIPVRLPVIRVVGVEEGARVEPVDAHLDVAHEVHGIVVGRELTQPRAGDAG